MTEQLQAGGRIVVGTDLSHNADHAVDWAAARAVEPVLERVSAWLTRSGDAALGWVLGIVGVLLMVNALGRLDVVALLGSA